MGLFSAMGVAESDTPIEMQIRWHLTSNHYPPLPVELVEPCIEAINAWNNRDIDLLEKKITLPEGIQFKNQNYIYATELIESLHLEAWIQAHWEEEE